MNLSVNGQSKIPPGFRFHPTEEELLHYYLKKKVACEKIDLDVIREVDLNKLEPWDVQEKCKLGSAPQNDWYFFSHKDKKYPTGSRTNRATSAGFWKATGRDKVIHNGFKKIGMRKTLVFYEGRAPHGQKSDWIMHEYRLDETTNDAKCVNDDVGENLTPIEGWVVCRIFMKKKYNQKNLHSPKITSLPPISMDIPHKLDPILEYVERSCKHKINNEAPNTENKCMHLPMLLENSKALGNSYHFDQDDGHELTNQVVNDTSVEKLLTESDLTCSTKQGLTCDVARNDWASYDRLLALQINGEKDVDSPNDGEDNLCFPMGYDDSIEQVLSKEVELYHGNTDMWSFSNRLSITSPSLPCDPLWQFLA